jgi:hypothetical protein
MQYNERLSTLWNDLDVTSRLSIGIDGTGSGFGIGASVASPVDTNNERLNDSPVHTSEPQFFYISLYLPSTEDARLTASGDPVPPSVRGSKGGMPHTVASGICRRSGSTSGRGASG